jgi:hypothetical protein
MNAIVSRPKNGSARPPAPAATRARAPRSSPDRDLTTSRTRADARVVNAFTYQSIVNEVIGQVATLAALNEYRTMIPIGM